ncbi:MAG: hypothetical protein JWM86_228 [Thermoleophilia bacterium]|nr:hypothetical protein [Thermoleophilia bacterium]
MGGSFGHAVGGAAPATVRAVQGLALPRPLPAAPVRPPAGLDPTVPFEPIHIGLDPRHDWFHARSMELAFMLEPLADLRLWLLRRKSTPAEQAQGTPGAPIPHAAGAQNYAVIGDFGEGSVEERRIAALVKRMAPSRVLTVGDNVYPTGRESDWQRGFDPVDMYGEMVKTTPFMPTLGNHDYYNYDLTPYFRRFPHLQGTPYYTWTSGEAQFFVLDTEQRLDGSSSQLAWLGAQLAQSKSKFKVVYLHRPPYSSANAEPTPAWRDDLHALLKARGVQLVIAGHEHSYERSHAIDGVTYMVTGGGGADLYPFRGEQPAWSAYRTMKHHFLQLAIEANRIVVRAVDQHGATFDSVAIPA